MDRAQHEQEEMKKDKAERKTRSHMVQEYEERYEERERHAPDAICRLKNMDGVCARDRLARTHASHFLLQLLEILV